MNPADSTQQGGGAPTAGAQEHLVPKHRFDEVNQRLQSIQQELAMKDQLLTQLGQQRQPVQQPTINYEELGLDPQLGRALEKIVQHHTGQAIGQAQRQVAQQLAHVANTAEEAQFLTRASKGDAKVMDRLQGFLPRIQELRQQHYRATGGVLPMEYAYKILRAEDLDRQPAPQPAPAPQQFMPQPQAQAPAPQLPAAQQSQAYYPNPALTQMAPGAGATPAAPSVPASVEDLSLEDLEARLNGGFGQGYTA